MPKRYLMLFRAINRSKGSFAAAVTMIGIGLAIYMALSMVAINLQQARDSYYLDCAFPDLFIQGEQISSSQIKKVARVSGVDQAQGRMAITVPFLTGEEQGELKQERVSVTLLSYEQQQPLNQMVLVDGEAITNPQQDGLVLQQFAQARHIQTGDTIAVQIHGREYKLYVRGIVESPEFIYLMENSQSLMPNPEQYGVVYVSPQLAAQSFGLGGMYNQLLVTYNRLPGFDEDGLIDDVKRQLARAGITQLTRQKDQLSNSMLTQEFDSLEKMCIFVPVIFLGAAAGILMMILGRMVKQDRQKIGIMKAIGYSNGQVLQQYLSYSLLAGLVGGALGICCSLALAGGMLYFYMDFFHLPNETMEIHREYALFAILLTAAFCGGAGMLGAREAAAIMPAQSMSAEAPRIGRKILLEHFPALWQRCSFSSKYIWKNILRNKTRSMFTILGMALSFSLMLFSLTMPAVMEDMMEGHFSQFMKMDYNVAFVQPVDRRELMPLQQYLPEAYLEGKLEYPFLLSNGNKEQAVSLIGLMADSRFYAFVNSQGQSVAIPKQGLLLTENLAKILNVQPGDKVLVQSYLDQKNMYLPVEDIVQQTLGINGYANIDYLARSFFSPQVVNGIMLDSSQQEVMGTLRQVPGISSILSNQDMRDAYGQYTGMINIFVVFLVALSGLLGFCIIYNSTIISMNERQREFSSLRVQGFTIAEIFSLVMRENFFLSLCGCLAGVPLGKALSRYSELAFNTELYTLHIRPDAGTFAITFFCAMLFLLLSQLITYRRISNLDFLQALKNRN